MTHTIELSPDMEARLEAEERKRGIPLDECLQMLVKEALPSPAHDAEFKAQFKTDADVVAYWKANNLIGIWADREDMQDSTEYVNRLQQKIVDEALESSGYRRHGESD